MRQQLGESIMFVIMEVCDLSVCSLECLDACKGVHGHTTPLRFEENNTLPTIDSKTCTECLACLRACPLDAISIESTIQIGHPKKAERKEDSSEERPYEIKDSLSPKISIAIPTRKTIGRGQDSVLRL